MTDLPNPELGAAWRTARPTATVLHLAHAACSRQSSRVLDAVAAHARAEAEIGAYDAQAAAEGLLQQGRSVLAGLLGAAAADLAFVESASAAVRTIFGSWRRPGRVGVLPGEYWHNLAAMRAGGWTPAVLPADPLGRADVAVADVRGLDAVHLTVVASHRGVVQPLAAVADVCAQAGVPLITDVAQAVGHVDCDVRVDAAYGTSRKWLAGPRGVGFLTLRPSLAERLTPVVGPELFDVPPEEGPARLFESGDAHIAGRVGLTVAVGEHLAAGPDRVRARLAALGAATRALLDGRSGWRAVEPSDEPTALTTLIPPDGADVAATVARLHRHSVLVGAIGTERARPELARPVLRVAPHLDTTVADLEALAGLL